MASKCLIVALAFGLAASQDAAHNLPILYRVDQPTSNVVVFRGANVELARAAGLIRGSGSLSHGGAGAGAGGAGDLGDGNGVGSGSYATPAPPPPPPPPTPKPYVPPPPPPPKPVVTYKPVYTPPPVVYKPAPVVYKPRPVYKPAPVPAYHDPYAHTEANYDWEYAVKDQHYNDFGHKESRRGYAATGTYYVALPDGRFQTVTYVADQEGYRPSVEYTGTPVYPEGVLA